MSGDEIKLLLETYRMQMASTSDPFLAVETSGIQPLPHQISAVYQEMLPRIPLRFLLTDDPGAGKTIMTGLLITDWIVEPETAKDQLIEDAKVQPDRPVRPEPGTEVREVVPNQLFLYNLLNRLREDPTTSI